LRPSQLEHIIHSNDQPNINLVVRPIEHALESYNDLAFLIPEGWKEGGPPPKKFVVFMDNTTHMEAATKALCKSLPPHLCDKIKWFHATMTNGYCNENLKSFRKGEIWGLFVTDAFGMGLNLPDIELVIQYHATCDFSMLWQRFGRAGRALSITATAIFLVKSGFFDTA
ncbi:P-loop containing nucleoside triphosphate hydrolase protein, partial [Gymnopus androsaceus JB14]